MRQNRIASLVAIAGSCSVTCAQTTLHVDDSAPVGGNGASWTAAMSDLGVALVQAGQLSAPVTLRIAGGWYRPPGSHSSATFPVPSGVALYGGYRGLSPGGDPDDRDITAFPSTLSGRLANGIANYLVSMLNADPANVLDGLTIRDAGTGGFSGGGVRCSGSPVIRDCTFEFNWGGAIVVSGGSPSISRCTFINNDAFSGGTISSSVPVAAVDCLVTQSTNDTGAASIQAPAIVLTRCRFIGNERSCAAVKGSSITMTDCLVEESGSGIVAMTSGTLVRCVFRNNWAGENRSAGVNGGAITAVNCVFQGNRGGAYQGGAINGRLSAYNCVFADNRGTFVGEGGAARLAPGSALVNCTFVSNSVRQEGTGGAIYASGVISLANCILWGNVGGSTLERAQIDWAPGFPPTVNHSIIQGWTGTLGGIGNSMADPRLIDPEGGDFRLRAGSPAIDAADAAALPPDTFDLDNDGNTTEPLPLDLALRPRLIDDPATANTGAGSPSFLDMGAFEYQTSACYANCDGSTAIPLLSVDDFACFQARFAAGEPYANCDGSTGTPALNVADFVCFLGRFVAGCP